MTPEAPLERTEYGPMVVGNEANARFPDLQPTEYRDGWLP
jgi:hypothetical protein